MKKPPKKASAVTSVPDRPHLLAWLKDPENAAAYVEAALDEGDSAGLLQALRNIAEARGGLARIAEKTGLNRETLYRTLSRRGNPQLSSLTAILAATGLRLSVTPSDAKARKAA
jgi:probable addiction module antidote protein